MNLPLDHVDLIAYAQVDAADREREAQRSGMYGPTRAMAVWCVAEDLRRQYIVSGWGSRLAWVTP